jgi:hypothetical protein
MLPASITFDEALVNHVGEFGPGQRRVVLACSLLNVSNALAVLLLVFLCHPDPVLQHQWQCTSTRDDACFNVWISSDPNSAGFCALPRDAWYWSSTGGLTAQLAVQFSASKQKHN